MNKFIKKFISFPIIIFIIFSCNDNTENKNEEIIKKGLMFLLADGSITLTSTDYDASDQITKKTRSVYHSKYALLNGVTPWEATAFLGNIIQKWNTKYEIISTEPGEDNLWFTNDDVFESFIQSIRTGDTVNMLYYSKYTMDISKRDNFIVLNNKQTKMRSFEAGIDNIFNTEDDTVKESVIYSYTKKGKIERIKTYLGDEETFKDVFVCTYDSQDRLISVSKYLDEGEKNLAIDYSCTLVWENSNVTVIIKSFYMIVAEYQFFISNGNVEKIVGEILGDISVTKFLYDGMFPTKCMMYRDLDEKILKSYIIFEYQLFNF